MKKKLIGMLAAIAMIFTVSGCNTAKIEMDKPKTEGDEIKSMFKCVEYSDYWLVVYHIQTKVMYAVSRGSDNRGDFTLLVNSDGTPMIWRE